MTDLLHANGFQLDRSTELIAPVGAQPHECFDLPVEWAQQWPQEELWSARKTR